MKDDQGQPSPGSKGVGQAGESMGQASKKLAGGKSAQANEQQDKAIDELELAREELAQAIAEQEEMARAEALAQVDVMLKKILDRQRDLSATTREVHGRMGDRLSREEKITLNELSGGEGRLAEDLAKVRKMLTDEGSTKVFPRVLEQVTGDVRSVQKLLADENPGEYTQLLQADIERSLEQMIESIRKTLAERTPPGGGGGDGGGGGGGGGKKPPLVPPIAELKMLLAMQQQVQGRTVRLHKQQQDALLPAERIQQEHKDLASRQRELHTMTLEMGKSLRKARR
jgi:nucleoid DNA-binding protein